MKVVLFCGGLGLRLRDYSDTIPKPLARIGPHPILWYVMKYYAHHGHRDFVLCLGHRGEAIKEYFLEYNECMTNDFIMQNGGATLHLYNSDIQDWNITFVDTGLSSSIGERLAKVRQHLEGEDVFLANYSDGLTDLPLDRYLEFAQQQDKVACFLAVRPTASFHVVQSDGRGKVTDIQPVSRANRINCGYFVLKSSIFDYMKPGEDLVTEPFQRLIRDDQLVAYQYDGFWECMDTFKDKQQLEDMHLSGDTPWIVWK